MLARVCLNIGEYPIRSTNRKDLVPRYRHQLVTYLYRATLSSHKLTDVLVTMYGLTAIILAPTHFISLPWRAPPASRHCSLGTPRPPQPPSVAGVPHLDLLPPKRHPTAAAELAFRGYNSQRSTLVRPCHHRRRRNRRTPRRRFHAIRTRPSGPLGSALLLSSSHLRFARRRWGMVGSAGTVRIAGLAVTFQ